MQKDTEHVYTGLRAEEARQLEEPLVRSYSVSPKFTVAQLEPN